MPSIKFEGGFHDGEIWPISPLEPLNKVDPWDDNTMMNVHSPLVPMEIFQVHIYPPKFAGCKRVETYKFSGRKEGDAYVYVYHSKE